MARNITTEDPITTEVIAESIKKISDGMKQIKAGRLNDKAIIYLLHKSSGVSQDKIKKILNSLESLEMEYLK